MIFSFLWLSPMVPSESNAHDIHLSKCRMKYSAKDHALQITLHIFIDDLESALSARGGKALKLCTSYEDPNANEYITEYLAANFKVRADEKELTMDFLGKEISEDLAGVWCYLEIPNIQEPSTISVLYDILLDTYNDQKNILSFAGPTGKESYLSFDQAGERLNIDLKK
jgi:hypothetical protein